MSAIHFSFPSQGYIKATFRALTDAILPPGLPNEYGYSSGDMGVHDYLIYALDHYVAVQKQLFHMTIPLSLPTAKLLDAAAAQLIYVNQLEPLSKQAVPGGGMFSYLSRKDRLKALSALENLQLDLFALPEPYQNNGGLNQTCHRCLKPIFYVRLLLGMAGIWLNPAFSAATPTS